MVISAKLGKNRFFLNFSLCAKFNRFFIILGGGGRIYGKKISLVDPAGVILTLKLGKNRGFMNFCLCAKFNRFFIILGGRKLAESKIRRFIKNRGFSLILLKLGNFGQN